MKTAVTDRGAVNPHLVSLQEEIAILERRLDDMGIDGDCAYEGAISKVYINLLARRKQQVAELTLSSDS